MHNLLAYQCCVTKTSQSNINLGTSVSCAASLHCSSFLPIQFTSRQHQHLSWCCPTTTSESPTPFSYYCPVTGLVKLTSTPFMLLPSHQPCQTHQYPFHITAQSPALSFTNAPFPLLPSYQPCQTHQHPFHTTALSLALSESPTPLLQNHQHPFDVPSHQSCQTHQCLFPATAQSLALSDSPTLLSYYCPVTSPFRITNTPFQNHQHPFFTNTPLILYYYCPITSPVRITKNPFMLLPSYQPCQNRQHPFHITVQSPALSESPKPLSYYCPVPALSEWPAPLSYSCPVTSPVRITNTPFMLLPSHQPWQNHQNPVHTTAQ